MRGVNDTVVERRKTSDTLLSPYLTFLVNLSPQSADARYLLTLSDSLV